MNYKCFTLDDNYKDALENIDSDCLSKRRIAKLELQAISQLKAGRKKKFKKPNTRKEQQLARKIRDKERTLNRKRLREQCPSTENLLREM